MRQEVKLEIASYLAMTDRFVYITTPIETQKT